MQAEHIPVHLGSMPDAVAAVLGEEHQPEVEWILNDPYRGGTHLPDITLVSPVFVAGELFGFAASRAHHADVGGPTPGSMPAFSRRLDEEGVVIPPTRATPEALDGLVVQMRNPRQRLADLRAQQSASRVGRLRLAELAERHGAAGLREGMAEILAYAERRTRAALAALPDGTYAAEDFLEDDSPDGTERDVALRVEATVDGETLRLDFSGTDPQVEGNLNCPLSVTKSAAFFAVRVLTDPDAPPCAGAHRPIEVSAPRGCLLNGSALPSTADGELRSGDRLRVETPGGGGWT
jgi:N-methylhydantoinase B